MQERKPVFDRPVTPLPGESQPIRGGRTALTNLMPSVPLDGTWVECKWPFSTSTSAADQTKQAFSARYPDYEFRTKKRGSFNHVWVRYRADEK